MQDRRKFQQRLFRHSLRKLLKGCDSTHRALIQLALFDRSIFEMVYDQTMEDLATQSTTQFGFSIRRASDGSPIVDNLLKLLEWFLNHDDTALEVIQSISDLLAMASD